MTYEPWLSSDPERAAKYDAKAMRWTARPEIAPCWRGNQREWHIDGRPTDDAGRAVKAQAPGPAGQSYQNQLYCRFHHTFINPSGFTCRLCRDRQWPEVERWRHHQIPGMLAKAGASAAEESLVHAVETGRLSAADAQSLAAEFFPRA